jgi:multisubunit Na+/H+ antiporter MnhB subunit
VLAVAIGVGLAALSYALLTRHAPLSISPFFLEKALPEGGGTNVVNVMLVDFRAFDTLGEITVLGIVGLTVYALLRRFRPARRRSSRPPAAGLRRHRRRRPDRPRRRRRRHLPPYLEVPAVLVRLLLPVAGLFAFHLFMRGHNEPGGGFVAGLVVAIAFIAQYMVSGTRWVEERLHLAHALDRRRPADRAGTGLGSLALGHPFLTTHTAHVTWPLVGEVHLPTRRSSTWACLPSSSARRCCCSPPSPPVAARAPPAGPATAERGKADGSRDLDRDRRDGQCRRVAGAAAADLPGADRPDAAVVCGQPVHLQRRQPGGGPRAHRGAGRAADLANYTDPLPQSLVLTAIVIGFATTALFLVVLLALRGLSGGDHVDGQEERP